MLLIKSFHIIAMVAWFAGLFYLPRLFVYHVEHNEPGAQIVFKIMERKLYYAIIWPSAIATSVLGLWLISYNPDYYLKSGWMHAKLGLVILLWAYHLVCGHYLKLLARDQNQKSGRFFRLFNEAPTLLLVGIVMLVVIKPF